MQGVFMKKKVLKAFIYVIVFAAFILLFYKAFVPLAPGLWAALKSGDEAQIEAFLTQSGKWKGLIYLFLLQAVQVVSIVLPGAPIEIAGGMAYGFFKSYITCHMSFVFANIVIFLFGRRMQSDFFSQQKLQKALKFLNKGDPFVAIILCFMVPVMPNGIIPYAASATKISPLKYFVGVYLGSSVQMFMMCAVGRYILSHNYFLIALLVILDIIAMYLLYRNRDKINGFAGRVGERIKSSVKSDAEN